ncbi:MAG: CHAT domain-containing protein [Gammaproteobacteria bacterium]|nr:CHAT domain-containing protein [Gammaproteobacteria bacterium]
MHLHLTDRQSDTRWRWRLDDARGNFLADREVDLGKDDIHYKGLADLQGYLDFYGGREEDIRPHAELLDELGAWLGERLFDGVLGEALLDCLDALGTPVTMVLPPEAQSLIYAPLELAHLDGEPLARQGIRLIYRISNDKAPKPKPADEKSLRVLAVFSLPDDANPLNLRRERYELKRLLQTIALTHNRALELRVLQYGATRKTLRDALRDGKGWDLIHFSGHGHKGLLALENDAGETDPIELPELARLLRPAKERLKLLTLSACHSGANLTPADIFGPPGAARRKRNKKNPFRMRKP